MEKIAPKEVRYIKLGQGGSWADVSIEKGELHFGYRTVPHELCLRGDWDGVIDALMQEGRSLGKAKDGMREVRDFYTLGADCLWTTFADRHLWWAFAEPEVTWLGSEEEGEGARKRLTIDGWRKCDATGRPLGFESLSTRLTQVSSYRQTICSVSAADYLVRRINGEEEPVVGKARSARDAMTKVAAEMIAVLHWADFETLVDLIFARAGWQRLSRLGGTLADVDLLLEQPTTGERAFVQVKSKANQSVLDDYLDRYRRDGSCQRFFFVCHSPKGNLTTEEDDRLQVWAGERLAEAAVKAGLYDWLIERVS